MKSLNFLPINSVLIRRFILTRFRITAVYYLSLQWRFLHDWPKKYYHVRIVHFVYLVNFNSHKLFIEYWYQKKKKRINERIRVSGPYDTATTEVEFHDYLLNLYMPFMDDNSDCYFW